MALDMKYEEWRADAWLNYVDFIMTMSSHQRSDVFRFVW